VKPLTRLTFLACLLLLVSCKTIDGTHGLPPFYEVYPSPSTVAEEDGEEVWVRPFYGHEVTGPKSSRVRSFPPFVDFRFRPKETHHRILPLYWYRDFEHPNGEKDMDWFFLPFFGGKDSVEGRYFAVFPAGGRLKGLLGRDVIDFFLFPLYWNASDGERDSLHLVWPFFNRVSGGTWSGWRLWPFYGRYHTETVDGEARSDTGFVLWPFYIRAQTRLHESPTETFFTFPFYGHHENRRTEAHTFLWPLYQYHHDKKTGRNLHMGFLFPFRFTDGQFDLWPLFGVKRTQRTSSMRGEVRNRFRQYFLWPIERYDWATGPKEETTRFWLLPLFWQFYTIDKDTFETRNEWKFWPLMQYRREGSEVDFDLIAPLWIRRTEYQRFYSRWFHIFRYRWKPHVSGWEVLYGALSYREQRVVPKDGGTRGDFKSDEAIFSVLGGLFACGRRDDRFHLRLFYIPWW